MRERHDGLLPVQQTQGLLHCVLPLRDIESHHGPLFEELALAILDFEGDSPADLISETRALVSQHAIGWTQFCDTRRYLAASLTEDFLGEVRLQKAQVFEVLDDLGDPRSWPFLCEIEFETADSDHLHGLDLYEQWCEDLSRADVAWTRTVPCPRVHFKERIVLHAYSGRRRRGDFQCKGFWFCPWTSSLTRTWETLGSRPRRSSGCKPFEMDMWWRCSVDHLASRGQWRVANMTGS